MCLNNVFLNYVPTTYSKNMFHICVLTMSSKDIAKMCFDNVFKLRVPKMCSRNVFLKSAPTMRTFFCSNLDLLLHKIERDVETSIFFFLSLST